MTSPINVDHPETLEAHPLADVWHPLSPDQLRELAGDVRRRGLLQPIVLLDGRVLDGRSRLEACRLAGVAPRFAEYTGTDPLGDITSAHLYQRSPGNAARALAAAQMVRLSEGAPAGGRQLGVRVAARRLNVGTEAVGQAHKVLERGADRLRQMVADGEVTLRAATLVVEDMTKEEQEGLIRQGSANAVRRRAAAIKKEREEAGRRVEEAHGTSPFSAAPPRPTLPPRIDHAAGLLTQLTAALSTLLTQPEGRAFVDSVGELKLGWILHSAARVEANPKGKRSRKTARVLTLVPLRRLLVASAGKRRVGPKLKKALTDSDLNGPTSIHVSDDELQQGAGRADVFMDGRNGVAPIPGQSTKPLPGRVRQLVEMLSRLTMGLDDLLQSPEGEQFLKNVRRVTPGWIDTTTLMFGSVAGGGGGPPRFVALVPLRRLLVASTRARPYTVETLDKLIYDPNPNELDRNGIPADEPTKLVVPEPFE